ncbi:hypothetical protein LTR36_000314 [Oleoguttula mirabilis]|uniref:Uncharacterized protein n=1 Tax=Oleoguttula mirabilis TaxID=1507867 RepID=A0AAV9JYE0_9PEZI|nr:hypothetical protein LTR36_000314 [Oleoguttula mirabilis]
MVGASSSDSKLPATATLLRDLLPELDLKYTISRKTPAFVQESLDRAKAAGQPYLDLGSKGYPYEYVKDLLERAKAVSAMIPAALPSQEAQVDMTDVCDASHGPAVAPPHSLGSTTVSQQQVFGTQDSLSTGQAKHVLQRVKTLREAAADEKAKHVGERKRRLAPEADDTEAALEADGEEIEGALKWRKTEAVEKEKTSRRQEKAKECAAKKAIANDAWLQNRLSDRSIGRKPEDEGAPTDIITAAERRSRAEEEFKTALRQLSKDKPTAEQMQELDRAKTQGPNHLGRTASLGDGFKFGVMNYKSNGLTTPVVIMPAADTHLKQCLHAHIGDLTQGELIYLIGHHVMWSDLPFDEFSSTTIDPLFTVTHALCRYHEGQGGVSIQFLDRRTAKDVHGQPAAFYPVLDLYNAFDVFHSPHWPKLSKEKLYPRKFTQEFVSHGTVRVNDSRFLQAPIEKLIEDGLYAISPTFRVPLDDKRAGLYTSQVVFRSAGFPPDDLVVNRVRHLYSYTKCATSDPFTVEYLMLVQRVTRNFMYIAEQKDYETVEPHLHIFLCFLTFQKRPRNDSTLAVRLKTHYKAADVVDLYDDGHNGVQPGFTHVADNLPGVFQYLDLVRDACAVFKLPPIPANIVQTHNEPTGRTYAEEDAKQHKGHVASHSYDADREQDKKDKEARRRRQKTAGKKAGFGANTGASTVTTASERITLSHSIQDVFDGGSQSAISNTDAQPNDHGSEGCAMS